MAVFQPPSPMPGLRLGRPLAGAIFTHTGWGIEGRIPVLVAAGNLQPPSPMPGLRLGRPLAGAIFTHTGWGIEGRIPGSVPARRSSANPRSASPRSEAMRARSSNGSGHSEPHQRVVGFGAGAAQQCQPALGVAAIGGDAGQVEQRQRPLGIDAAGPPESTPL